MNKKRLKSIGAVFAGMLAGILLDLRCEGVRFTSRAEQEANRGSDNH